MPNWCNNSITITGPEHKIRALWDQVIQDADDETGLLNGMVPMPEQLRDTVKGSGDENQTEKYDGFTNWYDWRVSNWGTKWEVSSEGLELSEDGTEITGWFDSAWAPPLTAFASWLERNEDCSLTCYYEEPGMDFAGKFSGEGGIYEDECIEDVDALCRQYIKTGEMPDDDLFKDIDEYFDLIESRREYIEESMEEDNA